MSDRIIIAFALAPAAYMFVRHIIDTFKGRA